MPNFALILTILSLQVFSSNSAGLLPTCFTGKLLQMESCPDVQGTLKMGYDGVTIDKVGDDKYLASGTVEVMEQVEGPVNISMVIYNCEKKFSKESCTVFAKWSTDGCKEMEEKKGTLYKMIKSAGGDDQKCPLEKNKYQLKNYEIKIPSNAATVVSTAGHIWYVSVHGIAKDDEMVLCTNVWLEIVSCDEPKRKYNNFGR